MYPGSQSYPVTKQEWTLGMSGSTSRSPSTKSHHLKYHTALSWCAKGQAEAREGGLTVDLAVTGSPLTQGIRSVQYKTKVYEGRPD